jgi:hypothetical protein
MFAFIISAFVWIGNALAAGATAIATTAWAAIIATANALKATGHVLSLFGQHSWGFLRDAWDKVLGPAVKKVFTATVTGLKDLWSKVLKPAWTKFNAWIDKAHDWLVTKFGPILCWLQKARKYLDVLWNRVLKPILEVIDVARAVLKIFSALGIDWAKRLDAKLAALEDWIVDRFTEVRARITRAEDWIDRIVDFDGFFQRVILLRSLFRDAGDAWNVLVGAGSNPITDDGRGAFADTPEPVDNGEIATVVRPYYASGDAARTELQNEIRLLWLAHVQR